MDSESATRPGMRSSGQRAAILLLAILQVVVTLLPGLGIGEPIGNRSAEARTLITPAGWAFSIWGPLYLGCFAYAVWQYGTARRDNKLLARIGWASGGAFLGNAAWALYAQAIGLNFVSALIILFTLACLLHIYRSFANAPRPFTRGEQLLAVLPLSALAGWLTAASIVNIAAVLNYHGIDLSGAAPAVAAGTVLVAGLIAGVAIWNGRGNPWYAIVFLWALAAIYAAGGRDHRATALAAMAAAAMVFAAALVRLGGAEDRRHWFAAAP